MTIKTLPAPPLGIKFPMGIPRCQKSGCEKHGVVSWVDPRSAGASVDVCVEHALHVCTFDATTRHLIGDEIAELHRQVAEVEPVSETNSDAGFFGWRHVVNVWGMAVMLVGEAFHDETGRVEAQVDFHVLGLTSAGMFSMSLGGAWTGAQNGLSQIHVNGRLEELVGLTRELFSRALKAETGETVVEWT